MTMHRIRIRPETYARLCRWSPSGTLKSDYKQTGEIEVDDRVLARLNEKLQPGQDYDDVLAMLDDEILQ